MQAILLACDRCQIKLNPDTLGFEGKFVELYDRENLHLCIDCGATFANLYNAFLFRKEVRLVDNTFKIRGGSGGKKKRT